MLRVAYTAPAGPEEAAAWAWLVGRPDVVARRVRPEALAGLLGEVDVAWVHAAAAVPDVALERLTAFAASGGGVLLTLEAAALPVAMGLERDGPNDVAHGTWRHDADEYWTADFSGWPGYPHIRGLATFGPHPLVDGLHNGTYCWAPEEGEPWVRCCYTGGVVPTRGRVVAVERGYITQNPARIVAWEYPVGAGWVLCIGAGLHFASPSRRLREQLERLLLNAFRAVAGVAGVRTWWPAACDLAVRSDDLALPAPHALEGALPDAAADTIAFDVSAPSDEQWDLAGRRVLLLGRERSGIAELWVHPHRVVASWDVAVDGASAPASRCWLAPGAIARELETARRRVRETVFVALEHAVTVVEYAAVHRRRDSIGQPPAEVEVTLALDLRRMWPFATGCSGALRFRVSEDGRVATLATAADDASATVLVGASGRCELRAVAMRAGQGVECVVRAALDVPLRVAIVAGSGSADHARALDALRRHGLGGLVRQRQQRSQQLADARLAVLPSEPRALRAVEWAKQRLDAFIADVPGVGRSLLAGYAPSRPGWNEARPGYAWFFGRDACWTAFALLALGEHTAVRQVLRFLGERQDVTGKVLHEATTSGQFHYDAADSTPLYLLLMARYLAWSGDSAFVHAAWPHVQRALDFCLSTDADGDGLIENTGVGHGWIEGGPLGGAHATLYLAAVWLAALEGLVGAAQVVEDGVTGARCQAWAARARRAIETKLYEPEHGYALDLRTDGRRTWTQTALHSVAVLLGAADDRQAGPFLDALAGDGFTASWGVRMLPVGHEHFMPTGYHSGTVWPLYTGWASLAEYRAGRPAAAFAHLRANLDLPFERQKGAFDEVLHGLTGAAAGVCPDQAWSAAMAVLPIVEGMLGVVPDAVGGRVTLAPALPREWDALDIRRLRVGETVYDLRLRRRPRWLDVVVRRTSGPALWVTLTPWMEAAPTRVEVDGTEVGAHVERWGQGYRAEVGFQATGVAEVRYHWRERGEASEEG
jgi:hypothetical protein